MHVRTCSTSDPCTKCEGHCSSDKDCESGLICYKKGENNTSGRFRAASDLTIPEPNGVPLRLKTVVDFPLPVCLRVFILLAVNFQTMLSTTPIFLIL